MQAFPYENLTIERGGKPAAGQENLEKWLLELGKIIWRPMYPETKSCAATQL